MKFQLGGRPAWLSLCSNCRKQKGSGYFASRGKIAPCCFAIWRQNSPNGYFAASAKLALILTQTLTQTVTLIPTLALTQTEKKHYFASRGKIATSKQKKYLQIFHKVSGVFQQNFNSSKNNAVLESRTGQFSRT